MKPLVIVSALKDEIVDLQKQLEIERTYQKDRAQFWHGRHEGESFIIGFTGIGHDSTRAGLSMLTDLVEVKAILGTGYVGGLIPELESGNLVIANEVLSESKGEWSVSASVIQSCRSVLNDESEWHEGRVLTVTHALTDPAQKQQAAQKFGAIAADMESAAVAEVCRERGIPFGVLRAVLDPVTARVPDPEALLDQSQRIGKRKILSFVAKNPQAVWDFPRLANQAKLVRMQLADVLPKVVKAIYKT